VPLRFADFRIDASTLQDLPGGGIRVVGQLTHPGVFSYRNPDGSERKEYRPGDEVFKKAALDTFAAAPITVNHPRTPDGQRLVTADSWKSVAIGHLGETVREDAGHAVADLYIRDAGAVARVKAGDLRQISCGYNVDYDPTPGSTPDGQRYDGVQRNIRGNHVALLPNGVAPRGGEGCALRLDSAGDEIELALNSGYDMDPKELLAAQAKITALETELAKSRTDAAEAVSMKARLDDMSAKLVVAEAALSAERLDALVEERTNIVAAAAALKIETKGVSTLALKRAIVSKKTPNLSARVDSLTSESLDAILAVYADAPHPSLTSAVAAVVADVSTERADGADKPVKTYEEMYNASLKASQNAWKNQDQV